MKKFFNAFKVLPQGLYRLNLALGILLPLVIIIILSNTMYSADEFTIAALFMYPTYWILARIGVWIYEGFGENKK